MGRRSLYVFGSVGTVLAACSALLAAGQVDYLKQVKPVLAARCLACHGVLKQEGGLRLDTALFIRKGGNSGPAAIPGKPDASPILRRITAPEHGGRMPPEGEPLKPAEIEAIRGWIRQKAPAPAGEQPERDPRDHWSFRPVRRPAVPKSTARNPIDAFLEQRVRERGLKPLGEAPRPVLIRRLFVDLVGMSPSPEEWAKLEADRAPGWYERLVDRLLADPRHGERWARHWMDVWRYSDWWGLGEQLRNSQNHIWHWRDWIVESLNADTGYDEMVREMLAADELYPNDLQKLRATGYLARNFYLFNRTQWLEETVEHVAKGFLGITLNCAKCHDHKYDPFQQADFYRFRAFFEPYYVRMEAVPGEPDLNRDGIPRAFDGPADTPTYLFIRGQETRPDTSRPLSPGVPQVLAFRPLEIRPVSLPIEARQPERRPWVLESHLKAARSRASSAPPAEREVAQAALTRVERVAEAMRASWALADAGGQDPALARAEAEKRAEAVRAERRLAVARAKQAVAAAERKAAAAANSAKAAAEKELAAQRSALEKAEKAAAAPVQPSDRYTPLIGALNSPTRFKFSGSDDPAVPWPAQSSGRRTALARWITDRRNPLAARVAVNHTWMRHLGAPLVPTVFDFGRKGAPPAHPELLDWLAAELMERGWSMKHLHRLIVTSAAYRRASSLRGAEANLARDPDNRYLWRREPIRVEAEVVRDSILSLAGQLDLTRGGPPVPASQQAASKRRSLYFYHSDVDRNLFLETFDAAAVKECYQRDRSIVPQQALALTNSALTLDAAAPIAERLSKGAADDTAFLRRAFLMLLGIEASEPELAAGRKALDEWKAQKPEAPAAARAHLVWALLNHNDFVTLR